MHLEFTEPSKRYADLIVPQGARNEVALDLVTARVLELLLRVR
jgi:uridine kinase